jgi:CubicO group peptidase (beta-lactamase class C family)
MNKRFLLFVCALFVLMICSFVDSSGAGRSYDSPSPNLDLGRTTGDCSIGPDLSGSVHQSDEKPIWEWPRSTPAEQGLDGARLSGLVELIRADERYPRLHSLLIVRNGRLVLEEYFGRGSADNIHTLQSVSKSFTSALVGIAIARGDLKGVDEKLLDFFPDKSGIENLDDRKKAITLQDLLTMRSGTDYHESGSNSPHHQLNRRSTGWDTFYLNRPMSTQPGTHFLYDSGAVIVTSKLIEIRTGKHADVYAAEFLFPPLDIRKSFWYKNEEGHPHTGGGLNLRSQDMAKLGQLYLQLGKWEGKQIIPADWVRESIKKRVDLAGRQHVIGYGYWWWIMEPDPDGAGRENIYAAMGFRAQYIFVIPEHNMVVVVTGDTRSGRDQRQPILFLYTHILPAVH